MSQNLNKRQVIGRLGQDPELKYGQSGTAICNFTVATGNYKKPEATTEPPPTWHRVTAFGKTAENIAKYVKKGDQIYVEGRHQEEQYQNAKYPDVTMYANKIIVERVEFLGGNGNGTAKAGPDVPPENEDVEDDIEEDLPF